MAQRLCQPGSIIWHDRQTLAVPPVGARCRDLSGRASRPGIVLLVASLIEFTWIRPEAWACSVSKELVQGPLGTGMIPPGPPRIERSPIGSPGAGYVP